MTTVFWPVSDVHDAGCVMEMVRGQRWRWRAHLPFCLFALALGVLRSDDYAGIVTMYYRVRSKQLRPSKCSRKHGLGHYFQLYLSRRFHAKPIEVYAGESAILVVCQTWCATRAAIIGGNGKITQASMQLVLILSPRDDVCMHTVKDV